MVLQQSVTIKWVWLTLPAIVLVGSVICLCIAITTSRVHGTGLWKSSPLTLFYHATLVARDETRSKGDTLSLGTEDEMQKAASTPRAGIVKGTDAHIEVSERDR